MKHVFCINILMLLSVFLFAQKEIKLEEIKDHTGDSVKICGKIFTARYFANAQDAPTLLNMGDSYPNQKLTVVIYGNVRKEFNNPPETYYLNKELCVTGKITIYKERPQIIIYSKDQIINNEK